MVALRFGVELGDELQSWWRCLSTKEQVKGISMPETMLRKMRSPTTRGSAPWEIVRILYDAMHLEAMDLSVRPLGVLHFAPRDGDTQYFWVRRVSHSVRAWRARVDRRVQERERASKAKARRAA